MERKLEDKLISETEAKSTIVPLAVKYSLVSMEEIQGGGEREGQMRGERGGERRSRDRKKSRRQAYF